MSVAHIQDSKFTESFGSYSKMLARLNKLSVDKHFDAYLDVSWEDPEFQIEPGDPRLIESSVDPFTQSEWFENLSTEAKAQYCLYRYSSCLKTGWHFENLLQRGLLAIAFREKNGSETFRYVHHEIIEESQHTLMFQEYVNRSGLPVRGMAWRYRFVAELIIERVAKANPVLFFVFVLGGEEPADHLQKSLLKAGLKHPLLERIMRIHVTEEARHLSFARHYLESHVPKASRGQRMIVSLVAPFVLGIMARIMIFPASDLRKHTKMGFLEYRRLARSPQSRAMLRDCLQRTRKLFCELGLMGPAAEVLWKIHGIWGD